MYLYLGKDGYQYSDNCIVKHSKNIIDLIEIEDYVNGIRVKGWYEGAFNNGIELENGYKISFLDQYRKIKTIWTKEQLKSIEYNIDTFYEGLEKIKEQGYYDWEEIKKEELEKLIQEMRENGSNYWAKRIEKIMEEK